MKKNINTIATMLRPIARIFLPKGFTMRVLLYLTDVFIARKYKKKYGAFVIRKDTSDYSVLWDIFVFKEFRLPVKIKPSFIVDLGAYVGFSAIYYAETYPEAKIVCVEPADANFEILRLNTEHVSNVEIQKAGIWSKETGLKITNVHNTGESDMTGFSVEEAKEGESYDTWAVTVDSILENSEFEVIDILKIDIEGSEKQIFTEGFEKWIDKVNIIVIEFHDRFLEGCSEALYSAINKEEWKEYKKGEKAVFVRKKIIQNTKRLCAA